MLKKLVSFSLPYAIMLLLLVGCAEKPKTFDEQYDLGVKYISEGNYEEAIIALSAAIEIEPNSAIAYLNRGNAYYEQKMLDNAISDYTNAISLNPDTSEVYINLTQLYIEQESYDSALEICKEGLDKFPNDAKLEELHTSLTEDLMVTPWEQRRTFVSEENLPSDIRSIIDQMMLACDTDDMETAKAVAYSYSQSNPLTALATTEYTTTINAYKVMLEISCVGHGNGPDYYTNEIYFERRPEQGPSRAFRVEYENYNESTDHIEGYSAIIYVGQTVNWQWEGSVSSKQIHTWRQSFDDGKAVDHTSTYIATGATASKSLLYGTATIQETRETTYVGSWYDAEGEVETSTDTKTYDGKTVTIGWQCDGGYDSSNFRDHGLW